MEEISITRSLDLIGYEKYDPVILASLVSEKTMLLIGECFSGKSLLLKNLAKALNLDIDFIMLQ